jgi:hypothetical protein
MRNCAFFFNLPKVGLWEILFMILTKRGLGSSTFSIISAGRVTSRSSPRGKGAGSSLISNRNMLFVPGRLEQPRQETTLLYLHNGPKEPPKEGPLSCVLLESPFASVQQSDRNYYPSLVSLSVSVFVNVFAKI